MTITKRQREELRMKFGGKCAYCGCELGEKWHADHVQSVTRKLEIAKHKNGTSRFVSTGELWKPENDTFENLFPACAPCNLDKSSMGLEEWRGYLCQRITEGLLRNSPTVRHGVRFGKITINPGPIVFWFEKYQDVALSA